MKTDISYLLTIYLLPILQVKLVQYKCIKSNAQNHMLPHTLATL